MKNIKKHILTIILILNTTIFSNSFFGKIKSLFSSEDQKKKYSFNQYLKTHEEQKNFFEQFKNEDFCKTKIIESPDKKINFTIQYCISNNIIFYPFIIINHDQVETDNEQESTSYKWIQIVHVTQFNNEKYDDFKKYCKENNIVYEVDLSKYYLGLLNKKDPSKTKIRSINSIYFLDSTVALHPFYTHEKIFLDQPVWGNYEKNINKEKDKGYFSTSPFKSWEAHTYLVKVITNKKDKTNKYQIIGGITWGEKCPKENNCTLEFIEPQYCDINSYQDTDQKILFSQLKNFKI
jgi:hypothetical protein